MNKKPGPSKTKWTKRLHRTTPVAKMIECVKKAQKSCNPDWSFMVSLDDMAAPYLEAHKDVTSQPSINVHRRRCSGKLQSSLDANGEPKRVGFLDNVRVCA